MRASALRMDMCNFTGGHHEYAYAILSAECAAGCPVSGFSTTSAVRSGGITPAHKKFGRFQMHHLKKASSRIAVAACLLLAAGGSVKQVNGQAASPTLDYQFFKDKVQAVFLHKREG